MPEFFTSLKLATAVDPALRASADAFFSRVETALPWAGGVRGQAALWMNQGSWPLMLPGVNVTADPTRQQQWNEVRQAYLPMQSAVIAGAREQAAAEGQRLAADVTFWNNVMRITTAVATLGISEAWEKVKVLLNQIRDARAATLASMQVLRSAAVDPVPTVRQQAASALRLVTTQQQEIDAGIGRVLGQANTPETRVEAGLGIIPVAIAAIGATAVLGIASGLAYWVKRQYDLRDQANRNAQEVLTLRQRTLDEMVKQGKITPAEWQRNSESIVEQSTSMQESQRSGRAFISGNVIALAAVIAAGAIAVTWLRGRKTA